MNTSRDSGRSAARDRAERLRRLRATATSTLVQREEPQTACAGEPVVAARFEAGQFVVADMGHPTPRPPHVKQPKEPSAQTLSIVPQASSAAESVAAVDARTAPPAAGMESAGSRTNTAPPAGVPVFRLDAPHPGPPKPALVRTASEEVDPLAPGPSAGPCLLPASGACRSLCRKLKAKLPPGPGVLAWVRPQREIGHAARLVELAHGLLTQGARRVLLIDAALEAGQISAMFDLAAAQGLHDAFKQPSEARRLLRPTGVRGLDVLPLGDGRPNPARVGRETWQRILAEVRPSHDVVLVDAACDDELGETGHVLPLAAVADAVCVAITLGLTPRQLALDLVERLQAEAAKLLGCVLLDSPTEVLLAAAA